MVSYKLKKEVQAEYVGVDSELCESKMMKEYLGPVGCNRPMAKLVSQDSLKKLQRRRRALVNKGV